jgi:hypothetical protein
MEELPALIEAGLAAMLTVGIAVEVEPLNEEPPHPANTTRSGNRNTNANGEEIQLRDRWAHAFIAVFFPLFFRGASNTRSVVRSNFDRKEEKSSEGAALYRSGSQHCVPCWARFFFASQRRGVARLNSLIYLL